MRPEHEEHRRLLPQIQLAIEAGDEEREEQLLSRADELWEDLTQEEREAEHVWVRERLAQLLQERALAANRPADPGVANGQG